MKRTRYTKFNGDLSTSFGLEDLLDALSDFLLDSGYQDPFAPFQDKEQTMENLREAIRRALESGELLDEEAQEQFEKLDEQQVEELIDKIIQRMQDERLLNAEDPPQQPGEGEQGDGPETEVRFEITDKGMDFLGYKALRDLLGPLGRSSFGRHDTSHEAAGVETNGSSKLYEFGDTLNLDITATLHSAFEREGLPTESAPLNIEYSDLHVHQSDYQSSCATVVLLDCSHSMVLYGEDRFTPAKRVGMALAHLIRTQFPGRHAKPCALPRFSGGGSCFAALAGKGRTALHQHTRGASRCAAHPGATEQGHEADRDDHGRQAVGADDA